MVIARTEWSPVWFEFNKIRRLCGGRLICLIMSMITDQIGQHKVLLPINHNYNKICDILGFFKLPVKHKKFREFFFFDAASQKKPIKCVCAMACTYQGSYGSWKSWKNTAGPGKSWKSVKLNKVITFFLKQMSKIL